VISITKCATANADNQQMNPDWIAGNGHSPEKAELPELEALGVPFLSSPYPMWVYDLQTLAFLEVNDAALRAYGYSRHQFLTMTLLDIRPPEDVERFLHNWRHPHQSTGERWRHVGRDGKVVPVSITTWLLTFRGRKAELVLARRDLPASTPASGDDQPADLLNQKANRAALTRK